MRVTVRVLGTEATIENGVWRSERSALAEMLNARLGSRGPAGDDPDPDFTAAQDAAEHFGGTVLTELPPVEEDEESDELRIY